MDILNWVNTIGENAKSTTFKFFVALVKEPILRYYSLIIIFTTGCSYAFAFYLASKLGDNQIILHYDTQFGVDSIGDAGNLYYIPSLGLVIYLINIVLAFADHKKKPSLSHLSLLGALLANQLIFIALYSLYLINFR